MIRYHLHPLTVLANLWRVLYLSIIPVLRGFIGALQGDFSAWLRGAWIDLLIFLLMITLAVWRWRTTTYSFDLQRISLDSIWAASRRVVIPWENVTAVSVVESFYLRPFRAARFRLETRGGPGFSILIGKGQARILLERLRLEEDSPNRPHRFAPRTGSVLAMALLTSNSLGGVIFISTFISQLGKLAGNKFSGMLVGTFEELARSLAFGIPPAAAAIGYMLFAGWLIGFLLSFLQYKNFETARGNDTLYISGGTATKRKSAVRLDDVNYIDVRQSVATKALKLYSLYFSATGYSRHKDDMPCIIPAENHRDFTLNRERLLPAFSPSPRQVAPNSSDVIAFIGTPIFLCAVTVAGTIYFSRSYPFWNSFILFAGLMFLLPTIYYTVVRIVDFSTGGFSKSGKYLTLRYSKGFQLHTVVIPENKIIEIRLSQNPLQQISQKCGLIVMTRGEKHVVHLCRSLNKSELQKILNTFSF